MTRVEHADNRMMTLEFFRDGQQAGLLRFERSPDGPTLARDAQDHIIMSARVRSNGDVVLSDGSGRQLSVYPANHFQQQLVASSTE